MNPAALIHSAYLLESAIASILSVTADGTSIEVSVVGDEGVIGVPIVLRTHSLPYKIIVQTPGTAWRMKATVLRREFDRCGPLHKFGVLLAYLDRGALAIGRLQPVSQPQATLLSLAADVPGSRAVPRDTVDARTPVGDVGSESRERQSSGQRLATGGVDQLPARPITILNRPGLQAATCECYRMVKDEFERFFPT